MVAQSNATHGSRSCVMLTNQYSFSGIHAVSDGDKGRNKGESMKTMIQNIYFKISHLNVIVVGHINIPDPAKVKN